MKNFRIVVGACAALVLAGFTAAGLLPHAVPDQAALLDLLFPMLAVPIITLNFWAWTSPEIIEFYFFGMEKQFH